MAEGKMREKPTKKLPKKITPTYLDNYAAWYLERYNGSTQKLRHKLCQKVEMAKTVHETDVPQALAWIEDLLARYQRNGWLNDASFAKRQAEILYRKGNSTFVIQQKLKEKFLSEDDIQAALAWLQGELAENQNYAAALRYAIRRRLGPCALPHRREELAEKHYNSLRRSGFSHDLATKILSVETEELLRQELSDLEDGTDLA